MNEASADSRRVARDEASLVLGLVILPMPGKVEEACTHLRRQSQVELGEPQDCRVPATAETAPGEDEALIARLEALPGVLRVEVVCAQLLSEEPIQ